MIETYVVPDAIRAAAEHGDLVVFAGAGLSALCGSPNWNDFANSVIEQVGQPAGLKFLQIEQLRNISDPRRRLSIIMAIAGRAGCEINFESVLHPRPTREPGLEAYRLLSELHPVFVTTNYDKWFDTTPPPELASQTQEPSSAVDAAVASKRQAYSGRDQLTSDLLFKRGAVIHLHGSYSDPRSMVITLRDYIRHYSDPAVKSFLREMFSRTVLFVGYGLNELEILEYVIRAATDDVDFTPTAKHHILFGYRSSEAAQTEFIENYFRDQCGIGVVKYAIDINGWDELTNVLRAWQPQLRTQEANIIEYQRFLDRCIAESTNRTQRHSAIRAIIEKPQLQQYLFNNISGVEWFEDLDEAGLFDPSGNVEDQRWFATVYLERIAEKVTGSLAERLLAIIRATTKDAAARGVDNWLTNWSVAEAFSKVQVDIIGPQDAELCAVWLKSRFNVDMIFHELGGTLLPKLLRDDASKASATALRLVEVLIDGRMNGGAAIEGADYHLRESLDKNAGSLGVRCGMQAVLSLMASLSIALGSPEDDHRSSWWRSAVEKHDQDKYHDDFKSALLDAVRDATLGCISGDEEEGRQAVRALLRSPYPTLVRVGIFASAKKYGELGEIFWEELKDQWLVDAPYWHEIYWFIRENFRRFSLQQRTKFLSAVERCEGDWADPSKAEVLNLRHRRDIYHAAFEQGDAEVDLRYQTLTALYGPPREHVDFHIFMSSGWLGDRSPKSPPELAQLARRELIQYLREFVPDEAKRGESKSGLASALADAIRTSEDSFVDVLGQFIGLDPAYQYGAFNGLVRRWSDDKTDIPWAAAFNLGKEIILNSVDGGQSSEDDRSSDTNSTVSEILRLVGVAFEDEKRTAPVGALADAYLICKLVIDRYIPTKATSDADAVSDAINNPRGRAIEALIRLLLYSRKSELETLAPLINWRAAEPLFDSLLAASELGDDADFAALAGMYISNLHFLSEVWVEANFDRIFSTTSDTAWRCATQGFAYQRHIRSWLYLALREGGHLRRMLGDPTIRDPVWSRAQQFVLLAYINGEEPLFGPRADLMPYLVQTIKGEKLSKLCWFLWTLRGSLDRDKRQHVLKFWTEVSLRVGGAKDTHAIELSALSQLAAHIDENLPANVLAAWVQSAPYADVAHHDSTLVEELQRLSVSFPLEVAQVFLAALQRFRPTYDQAKIIACVRQIARAGCVSEAERICVIYTEQGYSFLNPIYVEIRRGRIPGDSGADG